MVCGKKTPSRGRWLNSIPAPTHTSWGQATEPLWASTSSVQSGWLQPSGGGWHLKSQHWGRYRQTDLQIRGPPWSTELISRIAKATQVNPVSWKEKEKERWLELQLPCRSSWATNDSELWLAKTALQILAPCSDWSQHALCRKAKYFKWNYKMIYNDLHYKNDNWICHFPV